MGERRVGVGVSFLAEEISHTEFLLVRKSTEHSRTETGPVRLKREKLPTNEIAHGLDGHPIYSDAVSRAWRNLQGLSAD